MTQSRDFYLIYPPGLVSLGRDELLEKWQLHFKESELNIKSIDEGGILISCEQTNGLLLNHILKSPTRILLRIAEFKARDFPKLFNKISKLPWKDYLCGQEPMVEASSSNSKLFDSRKISKAIINGVSECYKKQPVKKKFLDIASNPQIKNDLPAIYFRAVDDLVTISLDTTGERLHKRGDKVLTGLAPIRESFAALLIRALTYDLVKNNYTLIDPMCGSGTFLIEAFDSDKVIIDRSFAYQYFPVIINSPEFLIAKKQLNTEDQLNFKEFLGFEINSEVVKQAKANCSERPITITEADLFKSKPISTSQSQPLVIINPPYGHRIGEKSEITLSYYVHLIATIHKTYSPLRLGIIIPDEYNFKVKRSDLIASYSFKNGGIPVTFFILGRPES